MRRLVLQMQMSVDGRVASDEDTPWQLWGWGDVWPWDATLKHDFDATFAAVDCILLSRPMAEQGYLDHWNRMAGVLAADPHGGFARRIGEVRKVVASRSPFASRWARTNVVTGPLAATVDALKREGGGDILCFGGVGFASALVAAGALDEIQLYVNPAAVGAGASIFGTTTPLRLLGSKSYACGMVVNRYALAGRR